MTSLCIWRAYELDTISLSGVLVTNWCIIMSLTRQSQGANHAAMHYTSPGRCMSTQDAYTHVSGP